MYIRHTLTVKPNCVFLPLYNRVILS